MKPLLTPFEVEIALGDLPWWWVEKSVAKLSSKYDDGLDCGKNESCCRGNNIFRSGKF